MNNAEYVVSYLTAWGLRKPVATGVVDALRAESGVDPTALNPEEGAYGIAQWVGSRKTALAAYAEAQHEPAESLKLQVKYLVHELNTTEQGTRDRLKAAETLQEGIEIWVTDYERPEVPSGVIRRADAEAGEAFGPSPKQGNRLTTSAAIPVTQQPDPKDSSPRIHATGRKLSESGQHFKGHSAAMRGMLARQVKL